MAVVKPEQRVGVIEDARRQTAVDGVGAGWNPNSSHSLASGGSVLMILQGGGKQTSDAQVQVESECADHVAASVGKGRTHLCSSDTPGPVMSLGRLSKARLGLRGRHKEVESITQPTTARVHQNTLLGSGNEGVVLGSRGTVVFVDKSTSTVREGTRNHQVVETGGCTLDLVQEVPPSKRRCIRRAYHIHDYSKRPMRYLNSVQCERISIGTSRECPPSVSQSIISSEASPLVKTLSGSGPSMSSYYVYTAAHVKDAVNRSVTNQQDYHVSRQCSSTGFNTQPAISTPTHSQLQGEGEHPVVLVVPGTVHFRHHQAPAVPMPKLHHHNPCVTSSIDALSLPIVNSAGEILAPPSPHRPRPQALYSGVQPLQLVARSTVCPTDYSRVCWWTQPESTVGRPCWWTGPDATAARCGRKRTCDYFLIPCINKACQLPKVLYPFIRARDSPRRLWTIHMGSIAPTEQFFLTHVSH